MSAEQEGRQKAEEFRWTHGLGCQPLGDLVALIEQTTGHDVAVLDAGADEHGLTMHDPERDVTFIGVARTRHPMRQRSTLAHELAHAVFADWEDGADLSVRSPAEIRADSFARHLLLPVEGLREMLGEPRALADQDLSRIVQRFLVSPALAAIALHGCGYIDVATKTEWKGLSTPQLATLFGWRDQYQSLQADADRPRPPQRLLARAVAGYAEGAVSLQTLASLRGLSAEITEQELREAGITPLEPAPPQMAAADLPFVSVDLSDLDEHDPAQGRSV